MLLTVLEADQGCRDGVWLIKHRESNGGTETELSVPERARLKELERENQELRAETAFLKKATAYFAREQR